MPFCISTVYLNDLFLYIYNYIERALLKTLQLTLACLQLWLPPSLILFLYIFVFLCSPQLVTSRWRPSGTWTCSRFLHTADLFCVFSYCLKCFETFFGCGLAQYNYILIDRLFEKHFTSSEYQLSTTTGTWTDSTGSTVLQAANGPTSPRCWTSHLRPSAVCGHGSSSKGTQFMINMLLCIRRPDWPLTVSSLLMKQRLP